MKKLIIAGIVIVALAALGGVTVLMQQSKPAADTKTASNDSEAQTTSENSDAKMACEMITLAEAKTLIGANATEIEGSGDKNLATTKTVTVDNCSYSADGATLGDMQQLILQIQSGPSTEIKKAYENYKQEYPGKSVSGLGDEAYSVSDGDQIVVLKGENWFFVGGGSMNSSKDADQAMALKAANIILGKL